MTWADVARAVLRWVKTVVLRIGEGSGVVAGRIARWPAKQSLVPATPVDDEGQDDDDQEQPPELQERTGRSITLRWLWLVFLAWLTWSSVQRSHPLAGLLAALWCCAAWRAGGATPETEPEADENDPDEARAPLPEATPDQIRAYLLPLIWSLIGDRKGVHLETVQSALVQRGKLRAGLRVVDVRRTFEDLGIPVRDQLRVGAANRPGIHREDLLAVFPAPSETTPPVPADAA